MLTFWSEKHFELIGGAGFTQKWQEGLLPVYFLFDCNTESSISCHFFWLQHKSRLVCPFKWAIEVKHKLLKPFFDSVFCLFQTCNIHNAKNVTSITTVFEIFSMTGKTRFSWICILGTSNLSLQNYIKYVSLWRSNSQSFHHLFSESEKLVHFRNIHNAGYFVTFLKIQRVKTFHIAGLCLSQ